MFALATLAPLDRDALAEAVRRSGRLVVAHPDDPSAAAFIRGFAAEAAFLYLESPPAQAAGAAQISDAMGSLSSGAKGSADAVREFGRAAEDLQKAIGTLRTAIAAFHLRT